MTNVLQEAREILKRAEFAVLIEYSEDAKALGGNESARNAKIAELTYLERAVLERAETEKRGAQLVYELSGMRADCLKWRVRNNQANSDMERI